MPGGRPVVNWIRAQEALPDEHEVVVVLDDEDTFHLGWMVGERWVNDSEDITPVYWLRIPSIPQVLSLQ